MATLSFEGETHAELVRRVRRWLQSVEGGEDETSITAADAIEQGAELTKEALRVVAAAAPEPIAGSEVMKTLTELGYRATDQTRDAVMAGLDALESMTGGSVLNRVEDVGRRTVYEMNAAIAKQILRSLRP